MNIFPKYTYVKDNVYKIISIIDDRIIAMS